MTAAAQPRNAIAGTATNSPRALALIRKSTWEVGPVAAGVGLAILASALLIRHQSVFQGDAVAYRIVARDPFGNGSALRFGARTTGIAIRYGRIGYPFAAWLLALGQAGLVSWTMAIVSVISYAASASIAGELCARQGRSPWWGLVVLGAPVMTLSMGILFAEPMVIALMLLAYLLWSDGHHVAALAVGAALPLVREVSVLALLPLVVDSLRRRDRHEVAAFTLTLLPYLVWATLVRVRVGQWPFLDHAASVRSALGLPLAGYFSAINPVVMAGAMATLAGAVLLHRLRPWPPVTLGALALALLIPFLGKGVLIYAGDSFRVMGLAQALLLVGVAGQLAPPTDRVPAVAAPA